MSMTLKQALDDMRKVCPHEERFGDQIHEWADAIDAHIAGMGEPVAWLRDSGADIEDECAVITTAIRNLFLKCNKHHVERYTIPLFTAPPIDLAAVREVIKSL